jgi:lysophospholipase L1-like esterase
MSVVGSFALPARPSTFVLAALLATAACGGPAEPTPPAGAPPRISCPASQTATSLDGRPVAVTYPAPTTSGGEPPVTVSCTHASGASFPVGATDVACTVRDARQRADSCGFRVSVQTPPRLAATRFLAFGDSLTEGKNGNCIRTAGGLMVTPRLDLAFHLQLNNVPRGAEYPAVLAGLLSQRYATQSPIVINEGLGGELAGDSDTLLRLIGRVNVHAPQALLLLEGVNDLNVNGAAAIQPMIGGLRAMMREARNRGVSHLLLATLLPQRPGSCRAFRPDLIVPANDAIRGLAANENAVLVDLYSSFAGQLTTLLGEDGLHPTEAGYRVIAESFFSTIQTRLEQR